jgi:thiamine kinase-like enzyme
LKDSLLIFIDFELTTKGDNAWDVACLIDSIIKLPAFKENPKKAYSFFYYFIDSYDKLMNYNESDFINFLGRVLKFWAVKSIDNWRRFNSEGIGDDIFFKSIQRAKLLLLNTDEYLGYIFDDNEKKYEIF